MIHLRCVCGHAYDEHVFAGCDGGSSACGCRMYREPRPDDVSEADRPLDSLRRGLRAGMYGPHGTICPVCDQHARVYRRHVSAGPCWWMANMMRYFDEHPGEEWVKTGDGGQIPAPRGGDYAKMRFWGFVEQKEDLRDDGSARVGWWRLLPHGRAFLRGEVAVPKTVFVYNNRVVEPPPGFKAVAEVRIGDVLHERFDFQKV